MKRFIKYAALLLIAAIGTVSLYSCAAPALTGSVEPVIAIEVGSGAFWAFVAALAGLTSVLAQVIKRVSAKIPGLVASAVTSAIVVVVVYAVGWVQLIPPGFSSWLGLWFLTYLSACGLFDTATLKGLIPSPVPKEAE